MKIFKATTRKQIKEMVYVLDQVKSFEKPAATIHGIEINEDFNLKGCSLELIPAAAEREVKGKYIKLLYVYKNYSIVLYHYKKDGKIEVEFRVCDNEC